jgi:hypothetical protein
MQHKGSVNSEGQQTCQPFCVYATSAGLDHSDCTPANAKMLGQLILAQSSPLPLLGKTSSLCHFCNLKVN